jgi:hypothetical protein
VRACESIFSHQIEELPGFGFQAAAGQLFVRFSELHFPGRAANLHSRQPRVGGRSLDPAVPIAGCRLKGV